jgi:hypothetical protein
MSPRDLSYKKAQEYSPQYADQGAEILLDQQFHLPASSVGFLPGYPIAVERQAVSALVDASPSHLTRIADALRVSNAAVGATAVLAPAVLYEAARPEIAELNSRLFTTAKVVAEELAVPCYATVFLGGSVTSADAPTNTALSAATALLADGWYFAFEFEGSRVPNVESSVVRYLRAGLTLAATGKPVLHGYAGPMAPLALACGGTGAGIGHSQNVWQFTRGRWEQASSGGGGGDAPPRYFSETLWGTVIYEDEWALLSPETREAIHSPSPFSMAVKISPPFLPWSRWVANKHLVYVICKLVEQLAEVADSENILDQVVAHLGQSVSLHQTIAATGVALRDETDSYQASWRSALETLKESRADDFELLRLIA